MALSGSTNFEPNVTEFIEEAFERCGIELRTGYDLRTAKRSINIMLAEWANRGLNQWTIEQTTQTVTERTRNKALLRRGVHSGAPLNAPSNRCTMLW